MVTKGKGNTAEHKESRISLDPDLAKAFMQLATIMDELREQCPWDQKQTIDSLRAMTLEETYELTDAIDAKDWQGLKGELGDILLHIFFYARIGKEHQQFNLRDVLDGIIDKMIRRHPHIYGDVQVENAQEVERNWQKIKQQKEKTTILNGVPTGLPSIIKAARIQEKASQAGFDWPKDDSGAVYNKVIEELGELQQALQADDQSAIEEELGDVFFSLINYARFLNVDADRALEGCNRKFMNRFTKMEQLAKMKDKSFSSEELSLDEMNRLWETAKAQLKKTDGLKRL